MYEIEAKIVEEASKCDRNYECLTKSEKPCCEISNCINKQIHFVTKLDKICSNYLQFGYSNICTCPVRKEIFNKYGE